MISIIIPTINEEESIQHLIHYLRKHAKREAVEIIIADGGSTDRTQELVEEVGARLIHSRKGRAAQMNAGAKAASGEILYFLHADTYPPSSYVSDINSAFTQQNQAGCFQLRFDYAHPLLKFYGWFTKFDIDFFRFGDQSLFVDRQIFKKVNGYDENLIVMEDQEIVREVKKITSFKIMKSKVVTSSRKYLQVGVIKLQVIFTCILILHYAGFSQKRIVKFYKKLVSIK